MTITDFCQEIHNFFEISKHFGTFTIENGNLNADFLSENQYFRVIKSKFNDGVHKYSAGGMTDETFTGAVWAMAVPPAAIALLEKMQEWDTKFGSSDVVNSPFQSENFGANSYSYTLKNSGESTTSGASPTTWQGHFKHELNKWRKI